MSESKNHSIFIWALVLYEIAIFLSFDIYAPALPTISSDFNISTSLAQLTVTAWMVGGISVQLLLGPLSDRYGRRPVLLLGGVLFILSTAWCVIASNVHTLMAARMFQGMAVPSLIIAGYAAVNELFDSEQAIYTLAKMNSVTIVAPAFGPLLGSVLLSIMDWRWMFVFLASMASVVIVLLFYFMPETLPAEQREIKSGTREVLRHYGELITNFKFMASAIITFFPIIGLIAWIIAGPFIVTREFNYSLFYFGIIQVFIFGSFMLGTTIVKKTASSSQNNLLVNVGLYLSLFGAVAASLISYFFPSFLFAVVGSIMVVGLGCGLSLPVLSRLTLECSESPMGVRVTVFSTVRTGAAALGSLALALFYSGTLLSISLIICFFIVIAVMFNILRCLGSESEPAGGGGE